ncbi:MAG: tetratricopeptide repeat protein [Candidatus Obscuribacterales bacterium]|nr:tetratricopeptide repeat protein [Candidatus Obscuribacterales bacterium]
MRISTILAALLVAGISAPSFCDSSQAQDFNNRGSGKKKNGRNEKRQAQNSESEDLEAPVDMSKFPGVGSIDSWKTSVPEFREGMNSMKSRRWDEAIAHFRASIALYEYQPKAWLEIGKAIEAKGGLVADAEKSYRQCVKLNSQSWNGWKCLSNVLYEQKRYDEAREAVSNALALNPPAKARAQMDKIVQMIDSGQRDSNTRSQNTGQ